jgi:hypothetical protein
MARRKRRQRRDGSATPIGTHEAAVLLAKLRELGHVTASHLRDARSAVVREVKEISAKLARLTGHMPMISRKARKSVPAAEAQPASSAAKRRKKRAKAPITAERRKIMQLQGRYLGLMHKVPKAELSKFKAMIPKVGKAEVIERMETYVRKRETKNGATTTKTTRKRVERKK